MANNQQKSVQVMHRLTVESYQALEKQVVGPGVNSQTSPTEAAYKLGVQAVLKAVRDGWVIG